MFCIGIIDDVKSERADIQVSILDNVDSRESIDFKEYEIVNITKEALFQEIRKDIIDNNINGLIVDFKLDTTSEIITGAEIVEFMHDETPEFPMIIMTNVPDESKESIVTDADKVYAKKVFLNPEDTQTKEMVRNIVLNMHKYEDKRKELEAELDVQIRELEQPNKSEAVLARIIEIENELAKYKQDYQSPYMNRIDLDELKAAADMLKEYKVILGE